MDNPCIQTSMSVIKEVLKMCLKKNHILSNKLGVVYHHFHINLEFFSPPLSLPFQIMAKKCPQTYSKKSMLIIQPITAFYVFGSRFRITPLFYSGLKIFQTLHQLILNFASHPRFSQNDADIWHYLKHKGFWELDPHDDGDRTLDFQLIWVHKYI